MKIICKTFVATSLDDGTFELQVGAPRIESSGELDTMLGVDPTKHERMLHIDDVAEVMGVSRRSVERMRARKRNPVPFVCRTGSRPYILASRLRAWLEAAPDSIKH